MLGGSFPAEEPERGSEHKAEPVGPCRSGHSGFVLMLKSGPHGFTDPPLMCPKADRA